MSSTSKIVIALSVFAASAACGESEPPPAEPFFPADYVRSYSEVRACRFSVEHDGVYIIVYASPNAASAYRDGRYPFAKDTVLLKREHSDTGCQSVTGFTVMKKTGTGSTAADWSWQKVGADRQVDPAIETERCASCHRACTNGRDFACTDP